MERNQKSDETEPVYVSLTLRGEPARIFLKYKKKHFLENNSEAARKAMFETITRETKEAA